MEYKAIALDLDGTLTDSEKKVSEVNKEAIFAAIAAGKKVILASGRPLFGVTPVAEELELPQRGGYILAYNGGNMIDCKTNQLLFSSEMPQECMHAICTLAREQGVYALTYFGDKVIAESDTDRYVLEEARCNGAHVMKVEDLEKFVNYPVAKVLIVGEHEKLLPIQKKLQAMYGEVTDIYFSMDYFLEVLPKNIAKDTSLATLLEKLQVRREELIACGDGLNDISMLQYAGLSVAMANAYPEVKKYADYVAPSNDDDGVADVIYKFLLKQDS